MFLKIDADQARADVEVEAMAMAPIPTPPLLRRHPPVLALAAVPGRKLGHLGEPSSACSAAWAAAGAAIRALHDAPLPPWPSRNFYELAPRLSSECERLVENEVVPADAVSRNRRLAETAIRPCSPVFIHGDLQVDHVFFAGYGTDVDLDLIRAWWSMRALGSVRWPFEHGYGPPHHHPAVAVLRSTL